MRALAGIILILLCAPYMLEAQLSPNEHALYPGAIPNAKEVGNLERIDYRDDGTRFIYNTNIPTLAAYVPDVPNGIAVILCPGGGYHGTAIDKEGFLVAQALNADGITVFVLKYRTPMDTAQFDKSVAPLQDAQQAIRSVRNAMEQYHLNPSKIGIMGFSAGGHVAALTATRYHTPVQSDLTDATSVRPDFVVLIYPVISLDEKLMHAGSRLSLLGPAPTPETIQRFSPDLHVNAETPQAFLVHAGDDASVPVGNSIAFYQACLEHGVPAEMHLYPAGGHGFGMFNTTTEDAWIDRLRNWLKRL